MSDRESTDQMERLEMLCDEVMGISGIPRPKTDLEILAFLESALRRSRGRSGWLMRLENVAWRCIAPLQDMRIRRQLQLHRDLLQGLGRDHPATLDSLAQLDDLVFARTYGRTVEAPVKKLLRRWVSEDLLCREDASILVANNCLKCDENGIVSIKADGVMWPIGVLNFLVACLVCTLLMALLVFSPAPPLWGVAGAAIICLPLGGAWWIFLRYTLLPHRLIPRVRSFLPRLQGL